MPLDFQTFIQKIDPDSKGAKEFDGRAEFRAEVLKADVAIKAFRLDQVDDLQLVDVLQVSAGNVVITGADRDTVMFKINCELKRKTPGSYTGHIHVLVIAELKPA